MESEAAIESALTTDCRGMHCPLPVVMLKRSLSQIKVGEVLELVATDPATEKDMPPATRSMGAELLKAEKQGNEFRYYVRRLK